MIFFLLCTCANVYAYAHTSVTILQSIPLAAFVLIQYTDRTSLSCLSEYLVDIETMELSGPTPFCTLSGL